MTADREKQLLKGVSRSFYLTLRLLPAAMRESASLAYLIARTSDTIADTPGIPSADRLALLGAYARSVDGCEPLPVWPAALLGNLPAAEVELFGKSEAIREWLESVEPDQAALVREVAAIIVSGQSLDLARFQCATADRPVALSDAAALEDYTFRVAGCVGAFWTKLGFLTMGDRYAREDRDRLINLGIAYGKGLQLVNILRDLPEDLAQGRCYLPVGNPRDPDEMTDAFSHWRNIAAGWCESGFSYSRELKSARLRSATVLPAMIAKETLAMVSMGMDGGKVKVPRRKVYRLLVSSLFFR